MSAFTIILLLIHMQIFMSYLAAVNSNTLTQVSVRSESSIQDMVFLSKMLFESEAVSLVDCAQQCIEDQRCVFFTFGMDNQSLTYWCRGHSSVMETRSPSASYLGAKSYVFTEKSEWLEEACTTSSECEGVARAQCYKGRCLCVPGYYYSHSVDGCIESCDNENQQQTILMYPGSGIYSSSSMTQNATLRECLDWCFWNPACRSLDYGDNSQTCYTYYVTPLEVPSQWGKSINGWDFYQKTCL